MRDRLVTNIVGLDRILGGGLTFKSNVLVVGKPGTGKSMFCHQILKNGLERGISCLLVTTAEKPEDISKKIEEIGLEVEEFIDDKELLFIDCYSSRLSESDNSFKVVDLSDLNTLSVEIERGLKFIKRYSIFIFDSFSEILMRNDLERASRFLSVICAKIKERSCIGIFTLVDGMHENKVKTAIEFLCDDTIHMTFKGDKRFIKVSRMKMTEHPLEKFEFLIKGRGIALRELEEFFEH